MSFVKDANDYAVSSCPVKEGQHPIDLAKGMYSAYNAALSSYGIAPGAAWDCLAIEDQLSWLASATKRIEEHQDLQKTNEKAQGDELSIKKLSSYLKSPVTPEEMAKSLSETPKPEVGTWVLTSPSGKEYTADTPMRTVREEQNTRVPSDVALARIKVNLIHGDEEQTSLPSFEDAWATYVAKGYQYGEDAMENVRFGYRIAQEVLSSTGSLTGTKVI